MSVYVSVCATFCVIKTHLITLIYKGCKSIWSITKIFLREKFKKATALRFCNFGSEMVDNRRALFFGGVLRHSLFMDLGHNQQQHPIVHSWGVSRVPCLSPDPPLPLTFRFPSAHLPLPFGFLWTLFVDTFCGNFWWTLF